MRFKRTRSIAAFGLAAVLAAGTFAFPVAAQAETSAELQQRVNDAYDKLQSYTQQLELANNQLASVKADLSDVQTQIEGTKQEITKKEDELKQEQGKLSEQLNSSYKRGDATLLSVVLGSSDFSELFSNIFYANKVADRDRAAIEGVKQAKAELEQKQKDLADQEAKQKKLVSEQEQKTKEVSSKAKAQQDYYNGLDSQLQQKLAEEAAAKAAAEAAAAAAAQKAAEEEAARQAAEEAARNNASSNEGADTQGTPAQNSGSNSGSTSNSTTTSRPSSSSNSGNTSSSSSNNTSSSKPASSSKPSTSNTNSGSAPASVVDYALSKVGSAYVWGSAGPSTFDCSGLVAWSYAQAGYSISHWSQGQYNLVRSKGHLVTSAGALKPGDLVFWGYSTSSIYHVGIYIGGGRYVHASMPGVGVVTSTLNTAASTYMGGGSPV